MTEWIYLLITFFLISVAAKRIGQWFSKIGLPYITGYLLVGMFAGPFILNLLPKETPTDLRFLDEIALAVIAFTAGSELYLKQIRKRLKSIGYISGGIILTALPILGFGLFFLTDFIPFAQGMAFTSKLAIAILGATILLALSPASTIAVIKEARAQGDYTRTVLGVTVTMDVLIVVLFAVAVAIVGALLHSTGFSILFIGILIIDLVAAVVIGGLIGYLLSTVMTTSLPQLVKIGVVLIVGYAIFVASFALTDLTYGTQFELHIEPILTAMVAGFYITNYTDAREQFEHLLHDISPAVYVAFFTLTGVGIKLDILSQTWPIALALFALRVFGIGIGSYLGSRSAGESNTFAINSGLGLITQAGIALGLAREVAIEFPELGDAFSTMVISVIVLNEIFGPMLLKRSLKQVGDSEVTTSAQRATQRDVVIFGIEQQSIALARQLQKDHWNVILADTDQGHVYSLGKDEEIDLAEYHVPSLEKEELCKLITKETDAVVAMLADDEANISILEIAYNTGVPRLVVRPVDLSHAERYREMNALVIEPTSAMVHLLEQTILAPQPSAILLRQDSGRELRQVTVSNPDVAGRLIRDLSLPNDVLFLDVTRNGQVLLPNGYTKLRLWDEVTIVGRGDNLEEAVFRLGY